MCIIVSDARPLCVLCCFSRLGIVTEMPDKLVTVATFSAPMSAHIARNQLEAAGILAFLADEATVGTAWHLGTAVGGIKLQVVDSDAEHRTSGA